ncbi:acyltransferase-domain-containing protein [Cucurbitaria berberidis CBS 394.84]|uniref:Acyltransferase-domain-containing protein n=1 Tax=Cucurbitaria berberidis CBS 394.84 TaxID=1168544 RepID=A0A9P4GTR4_9PLEO|nr:acyltransferase-domain-containing protein [Cucurbitaria berberidis CBS 394.84]KAF1851172.1 acyltransferase-domain-containing protein [Cucurbitaria berberidis CBS 394.84]
MNSTMTTEGLKQRQRQPPASVPVIKKLREERLGKATEPTPHPGGKIKHGVAKQALRMFLFAVYFSTSIFAIAITQYIGLPLYFYSKDLFYAWMALSKQHFGIVSTTMTYWWAPVKMRISGDESVRGQFRKTEDGRLECDFPERMVLVSNHQIYTDWVYLWWISYTASMHGHLYIILKESIRYIPILGTGMMLYGFIFLSRKWSTDKERFQHRLKKLSTSHSGPLSGSKGLDPMWLLIFPEGTNLSDNGRIASKKWADKNNIEDLRHALLPRSTGLSFCLQELKTTVDYMYDCTLAYEGVPVGQYGQDLFTLRGTYFQGRPPKSVNMHWRRFRVADIPTHDEKVFSDWLLARWREKDDLLQYFVENQRFPADEGVTPNVNGGKPLEGAGWIETEVRPVNWYEWLQIFVPFTALALVINVILKMANIVLKVLRVK